MKYLLLIIICLPMISMSQSRMTKPDFLKGADKPVSFTCNESCIIQYKDFSVFVEDNEDGMGHKIEFSNKQSKKIQITNQDECIYYGAVNQYLILSCGTDVISTIQVYNINSKEMFEIPAGVINVSAKNNKLILTAEMSEEKIKSKRLKKRTCESQICGYFEELVFDLESRKIVDTGKYKWVN